MPTMCRPQRVGRRVLALYRRFLGSFQGKRTFTHSLSSGSKILAIVLATVRNSIEAVMDAV